MVLPVPHVQYIFQYAVLHTSVLPSSFKEVLCIFDSVQIEIDNRLRSKSSSDGLSNHIFCGCRTMGRVKSISVQIPVSVDNIGLGHGSYV